MHIMKQAVDGRAAVEVDVLRHLADAVAQKIGDALQAVFVVFLCRNSSSAVRVTLLSQSKR